jgi:thioredoxin-like negative regulator of GroEL
MYSKGLQYLRDKKLPNAEQSFSAAIDISPSYVEARLNLAQTLLYEQKKSEAADALAEINIMVKRQTVKLTASQRSLLDDLLREVK